MFCEQPSQSVVWRSEVLVRNNHLLSDRAASQEESSFPPIDDSTERWGPPKIINVSKAGGPSGTFTTIQSAIDSVPVNNNQWIQIKISAETYAEKVSIPPNKPCIYLEGAGASSTTIKWGNHETTSTSSTFESTANNVVAKGITFVNNYNNPPLDANKGDVPAVAAKIEGDKCAFYECAFKGVQDTLFDKAGRHYFYNCFIQGHVDFIFGNGQSIFANSTIDHREGPDSAPGLSGFIAAQARESENETTGFVFNQCMIRGTGKVHFGRAYRNYSRTIFANSHLTNVVDPEGWNDWGKDTSKLTFVEEGCNGEGADKSKRVTWAKHMEPDELNKFTSLSYIDQEGWLSNLPI